ncbi:hypothetical protein Glove_375g35 [Diversispora epigaea]|uniref:Retrotransposon gag domain-containing protein n=1 Tax=Diversispora epigaea TaxID=1348612 RepID=A0A397H9V5_9GLOM|nr:hypothetical protein Glove_375g35 [Diversispora epigaea]
MYTPDMQNSDKLYHFKKGLRKGMLPLISMHNPEDIATVIELAQYYEEAEDLEEGLEPEENDAADEWYNEVYTQTYGNGNDEWPTWTRIKELFLEQFCNRKWMNKWIRELEKLKQQPGESVDQYAARFKKIIRKGAPDYTCTQNYFGAPKLQFWGKKSK